jgi:hypothetical protein
MLALSSNNKPNTIILLFKPEAWDRYWPLAPTQNTHFPQAALFGCLRQFDGKKHQTLEDTDMSLMKRRKE